MMKKANSQLPATFDLQEKLLLLLAMVAFVAAPPWVIFYGASFLYANAYFFIGMMSAVPFSVYLIVLFTLSVAWILAYYKARGKFAVALFFGLYLYAYLLAFIAFALLFFVWAYWGFQLIPALFVSAFSAFLPAYTLIELKRRKEKKRGVLVRFLRL